MMMHNFWTFSLSTKCFLFFICTKLSLCSNKVKFCGRTKQSYIIVNVSCLEQSANDSNFRNQPHRPVCGKGKLSKLQELTDEDLRFAMVIELQDCALKPGIFESVHLPSLEVLQSMSKIQNGILQNNTFLGLCSVEEIVLANNGIELITPSAFSCLSVLVWLDLSYNKLKILTDYIFKELESLINLYLHHNTIHTISEGIFDNLINLKELFLHNNYISSLPDTLFRNLRNLINLNLSYNRIETLNKYGLSHLTKLLDLSINNNKLKILTGVFSSNKNLKFLLASENKELILNKYSLTGLFNLKALNMNKCNITSLPFGLFTDSRNLQTLNMKFNFLREINGNTFALLRNLNYVDLSFNYISELRDKPFKNNNLINFNISNNKLLEIKKDSFQGLSSIKYLDISSNKISKIDENAFQNMPNLTVLNMNRNRLSVLLGSRPFGSGEKLHIVVVSNNYLTDVSNINWEKLPSLEYFYAFSNKIEELFIPHFTRQDAELHLEWNNIRFIHLNIAKEENVTYHSTKISIYLKGNSLECNCYAYKIYNYLNDDFMPNVKFSDGLVCDNPKEFRGVVLNSLKPNDFICNTAELCPERCHCTYIAHDNTNIVNCSNKGYTYIPLKAPYNASILDMSYNTLTSLTGLNETIWENLTEIHAEYNEISLNVFYLPNKVNILYLHHNKLKIFPSAIKKQLERKNDFKISISNNLWPCDCSIIYLKRYINQILDIKDVHCIFGNNSLSSTNVLGLDESDICTVIQYSQYAIGSAFLFFIVSVLIFYYRHKLYVMYCFYSHCNSCYKIFFCNSKISEDKMYDCFISYSSADREVTLAILDELENKPPYYKFCIHERDWVPGHYITSNIIESVENSRKTLIIVSETFLKSSWFYLEFQAAYHKTLHDKTDRLVIILKGELPSEQELDSDVLQVIASKTYLQWGERWFWEKLRYAIYKENNFPEQKSTFWFSRLAFGFLKKNTSETTETIYTM